jgi:nucleotide-binding universal stress UspA family protein
MHDVVVGIDRSETARRAAEAAAELAVSYGANLHIVMCVERTEPVEFAVGSERFHFDWLSNAEQYLETVESKLRSPSITHTVGLGDPAAMLCEEAGRLQARAIVVGNRRVQGVGRVLGSVAGDVIKRASCDVLVANTKVPTAVAAGASTGGA